MKLTGTDRQTGGQDQILSQADALTKNTGNKTKSKVFNLERLYKVCIKQNFKQNFRSEKYFVSENNFQKKIWFRKILV